MEYQQIINLLMEYQKIINLLEKRQINQLNLGQKIRSKYIGITRYNNNSQIKFNTTMLKSSDAYIPVKGTISVSAATGVAADINNKKLVSKNCAPFTDCISEINSTEVDNAKTFDVVMPIYKLIEYSGNYLKTSGCLRQCYRDEPITNDVVVIVDFTNNGDSNSFNFNQKLAGQTAADSTINIEIIVP